jgi:hypothetical protein
MDFTKNEKSKLFKAFANEDDVLVHACNGMGQEFKVVGKIAEVMGSEISDIDGVVKDRRYCAILNNSIILDYCIVDEGDKRCFYRSNYSAQMFTSLDSEVESISNFYIDYIVLSNSGKLIYRNSDYPNFLKVAKKRRAEYIKSQQNKDVKDEAINNLCDKLIKKIGNPIDFNGVSGILYFVNSNTTDNTIRLHLVDCRSFRTLELPQSLAANISKDGVVVLRTEHYNQTCFESSKHNFIK